MATFTPLDTLRAALTPLTSCLPALPIPTLFSFSAHARRSSDDLLAGRDELEGLLADADEDERGRRGGDVMSLRSEGGRGSRRQAGSGGRKGKGKGVQLCGLELFGRPRRRGLPTEEDEADEDEDPLSALEDIDPDPPALSTTTLQPAASRKAQPWERHNPALSLTVPREEVGDAPTLTSEDIRRLAETRFVPEPDRRARTDAEAFGDELDPKLPPIGGQVEDFSEFMDFAPPPSEPASQTTKAQRLQEDEDAHGDFGSLYARPRRTKREGGEGSSSGTPSLSSHSTSRQRPRPAPQHTARSIGSKRPSPPSSAGSVRTPGSAAGLDVHPAGGRKLLGPGVGGGEGGFEGWIGSGEGAELGSGDVLSGRESMGGVGGGGGGGGGGGWPSTGLTRVGRR